MSSYAAIHIARKQLGLDEDTARDVYENVTGKRSLRAMSESERLKVVSALEKKGFKPTSKFRSSGRKKLSGRFARKLQALWIAGWNLGVVKNRDDDALIAFVKRQTRIDHVRFVKNQDDADKAIEALKAWLTREAGVDWSVDQLVPKYARSPGFKIAWAQWRILGNNSHAHSTTEFWGFVREITGQAKFGELGPTQKQWIAVMNALGERVRRGG